MKKNLTCLCLTLIAVLVLGNANLVAQNQERDRALIQIAVLLDTSNSMDGLIGQAKSQLWKIVNELATTKKDGKVPELQVALYEYGKQSLPGSEGYLRLILPFTTDLDKMSEELFALKTNGGDEYCGWVIKAATQALAWSKSHNAFKAIFIAGNEPFTQGPVDYRVSCRQAIAQGIIVNTIHCGSQQEGVASKWYDGALLADGSYMTIDQNTRVAYIAAPQDKDILVLNNELNKTYIAYGNQGRVSQERQMAQDSNAANTSGTSAVQRALSKSSTHYRNSAWDLVDASKEGNVKIEEIKSEELPAEMQKMTIEERKAYIKEQEIKRAEIQEKIKKLNAERERYVTEETKKQAASGENTLDAVMIKALRQQLQKKNYETK
jgi:hypothetical protein